MIPRMRASRGGGGLGGAAPMGTKHFYVGENGIEFAPFFSPQRVRNSKERNLSRESAFCGGEDVTDTGSKNRDIHISGLLLEHELRWFDFLVESDETHVLILDGWSGQIRVQGGEWEGPVAWEPQHGEYLYKYSFDFVSTGRDEGDRGGYEDGIISDGSGGHDRHGDLHAHSN